MVLRLFRIAIVIGLFLWADKCLDLSESASAFVDTALAELDQSLQR
jgi:hypothetical protein